MIRIALFTLLVGCSSSSAGGSNATMTDAFVNPAFGKLRLGHSSIAEVQQQFPKATLTRDKSLGGTGSVSVDKHPAINFDSDAATGSLAKLDADPVVIRLETFGAKLCSWAHTTIGPTAKTAHCRGNRKVIDREDEVMYCLADGAHEVQIECRAEGGKDDLSYRFVP